MTRPQAQAPASSRRGPGARRGTAHVLHPLRPAMAQSGGDQRGIGPEAQVAVVDCGTSAVRAFIAEVPRLRMASRASSRTSPSRWT
jgi:hypothetical protein